MSSSVINGVGTREVLSPVRGITEGARALGGARARAGIFPYQWIFPGPNSKTVRAAGSVIMPAAYGTTATVLDYAVPQGMRFSLRAVVIDCTSPDWNQGSGELIFNVAVVESIGPRFVDGLSNIRTTLGSRSQPFPVFGRLEFEALTKLRVTMLPVSGLSVSQGYGIAMLCGHLYPNSESGEG